MAGGLAFDNVVMRSSRERENLDVEIHFTLVIGKPILPHSEIPTLVDSSGNFHSNYNVLVKRCLTVFAEVSHL